MRISSADEKNLQIKAQRRSHLGNRDRSIIPGPHQHLHVKSSPLAAINRDNISGAHFPVLSLSNEQRSHSPCHPGPSLQSHLHIPNPHLPLPAPHRPRNQPQPPLDIPIQTPPIHTAHPINVNIKHRCPPRCEAHISHSPTTSSPVTRMRMSTSAVIGSARQVLNTPPRTSPTHLRTCVSSPGVLQRV